MAWSVAFFTRGGTVAGAAVTLEMRAQARLRIHNSYSYKGVVYVLCSLAPGIWQENSLCIVCMLNEYSRDMLMDFFYCVE